MADTTIVLPSKPKIIKEDGNKGTYEIDGLYPGYGHTLGNSLRRVILSSLEGSAITSIKIKGVGHEFSALEGVKDDVIMTILNLKKLRFHLLTSEAQTLKLSVKGPAVVTGSDIKLPAQVEIMNAEQYINEVTDKNTTLEIEIVVEKGLGYMSKEMIQKERVDIGTIAMDAIFSPARRVSYEVENMRVGNRTDFNRLTLNIETDGSITPHDALEKSIQIMISQLKSIVGFKEEEVIERIEEKANKAADTSVDKDAIDDILKTRVESLDLSQRTTNALINANIRTLGGLARKKEKDLSEIEGMGAKGIGEVKKVLKEYDIELK
ncbi:MAG: DNA-directed polymerase subunit alpha, DNA-directed polymerase subunit alpha [Candidatus Taylorbacteria bacterium]|nr:DNA-directed polymerase subunit alpha, DNA-directed polymerase subunit alpha [Candidatus Taylorbacteria bacterium]